MLYDRPYMKYTTSLNTMTVSSFLYNANIQGTPTPTLLGNHICKEEHFNLQARTDSINGNFTLMRTSMAHMSSFPVFLTPPPPPPPPSSGVKYRVPMRVSYSNQPTTLETTRDPICILIVLSTHGEKNEPFDQQRSKMESSVRSRKSNPSVLSSVSASLLGITAEYTPTLMACFELYKVPGYSSSSVNLD
ncbi:uncharacterized protein BDZ83DRAFT_725843 [Colletotrichum acutatum]|uniref:Uncharacterized protein n=1 Tax=Glomerella acutata TaxID=27357 RepID=A0AAD8XPL0_GLOAC|nr:uncharacterized protein BDZ83DRAFT_725843 [Colletotrichum acutatum]KAK1731330.1 hypothetical protein BDZ83DRAFT_725843 [Colletotrichum acutatum]